MNLAPIGEASSALRIHLLTVVPAFFIGGWLILFSAKGSRLHRTLGVIYLVLMTVTAITTYFIRTLNPPHLSFIHLFIPLTLWGVASSVIALRRGDIRRHKRAMIGLYVGAMLIAGGLTFLPGRLMHEVFFG